MQKQMSALENSGTEIKEVKYEQDNYWSNETTTKKVDVTVINNFTKDNFKKSLWNFWYTST